MNLFEYMKNYFTPLTSKKVIIAAMAVIAMLALANAVFAHDDSECACNKPPPPPTGDLACLDNAFDGPTGDLKMLRIPIQFPGRMTIGDLDHDGIPDFVVARRHSLAAYNVCGKQLWKRANRTNWDNTRDDNTPGHDIGHVYWNWTSYGWIGDADGDGTNEYMNIAEDWRTLIIRDAATGKWEVGFDLGPGKWQYVTMGKVDGWPRVFVTSKPGQLRMKSLDLRNGLKVDWSVYHGYRLTHYIPPQVGDINADGNDDLMHGTAAVDGRTGDLLWRHGFGRYGIGGAHTGSLRDVDPDKKGLEAVVSVYSPKSKSSPSLVIVDGQGETKGSFHNGDHPHAHAVGDFQPDRPGLETFARGDGQDHWLIDKDGEVIANVNWSRRWHSRWGMDWGDDAGELLQTIQWDGGDEDELLLVERHVNLRNIPMMIVVGAQPKTRVFHGGIDVRRTDPNPLGWYGKVKEISDDGPYEGGAHVADLIGDGREEVVALGHNQIIIYYNSGDAGVPKKWGVHAYETRKKLWAGVYSPR